MTPIAEEIWFHCHFPSFTATFPAQATANTKVPCLIRRDAGLENPKKGLQLKSPYVLSHIWTYGNPPPIPIRLILVLNDWEQPFTPEFSSVRIDKKQSRFSLHRDPTKLKPPLIIGPDEVLRADMVNLKASTLTCPFQVTFKGRIDHQSWPEC